VSAACEAASVPPTTALRWINVLERKGLLLRIPDPLDGRRFWVALTETAQEKMKRYFETICPR
jgi:DNA-binding MarR family transcriptional regulator